MHQAAYILYLLAGLSALGGLASVWLLELEVFVTSLLGAVTFGMLGSFTRRGSKVALLLAIALLLIDLVLTGRSLALAILLGAVLGVRWAAAKLAVVPQAFMPFRRLWYHLKASRAGRGLPLPWPACPLRI